MIHQYSERMLADFWLASGLKRHHIEQLAEALDRGEPIFVGGSEDDTLVLKFNDFGGTQREHVISLFRDTESLENLGEQATTEG